MQHMDTASERSSTGGKRPSTPVHDVSPNGTALSYASTQLWDARSQAEATPLVVCVATRQRPVPVTAPVRLPPGPGPHVAPAGSGG